MSAREPRFWAKVSKGESCWLWMGAHDARGYGFFKLDGKQVRAHRVAYEWARGPIPEGLQIDHRCRVRSCVNPDHLEPVTPRENTMRSTLSAASVNAHMIVCKAGEHVLGFGNDWPSSGRTCRSCQARRQSQPTPCPDCGRVLRADSLYRHARRAHAGVFA